MKKTIAFLITAIIFTGIGIWISPFATKQLEKINLIQKPIQNNNDTFEAGWNAARQRLIENGYMQDKNTGQLIHYVTGLITSIKDNYIVIDSFSDDLLATPELKQRTIYYEETTPIAKHDLQNEQKELITVEGLQIGQSIEVYSEEEINKLSEIYPKTIVTYDLTDYSALEEIDGTIKAIDENGETVEIDIETE